MASTLEASLFRVLFSGIAAAGVVSAVIDVVGKPFAWRECGECGMIGRALASSVVLRRSSVVLRRRRAGSRRVDSSRPDSFRAGCLRASLPSRFQFFRVGVEAFVGIESIVGFEFIEGIKGFECMIGLEGIVELEGLECTDGIEGFEYMGFRAFSRS